LLILSILAGFTHTAIEFLVRLLLTSALIALLLLLHEFGVRWLRILRRRMIRRDRVAKLSAALEAKDNPDEPAPVAQEENDPDPEALDTEGRKLIHIILAIAAVFGVYGIWADVLPALGILNTVELWQRTELINGVDKQVAVTLADVGFALLVGLAGYAATQRIPPMIEILMRQRMNLSAGNVYAVGTLLRYAMITVVAMMVLSQLGGRWGQIQWAVAALSVGIGFGLQEIVANFISGLILLFEQPIRVGDTVTVGETSGVVTRIRMRATTIRDWDGRELLVPNKEFITGRLLNWSLSDRQTRFQIVVGVAYGTDLKLAMQTALAAAHEHPDVLEDPAPFITFDNFGDNSLTLVLRCYLGTIEKRLTVASEVRSAVNEKFNEHGICVAFPQRDVHLDTTRPLEVTISKLGGGLPAE
jgi:potassium efflux system protein